MSLEQLLAIAKDYDQVIYEREQVLIYWRKKRGEIYTKLREVCPHTEVETYSLAGQTERQCKICKADLSKR